MNSLIARMLLPASDRDIYIDRIDLDAVADTADSLGSDQRTARTKKCIEYDVATCEGSRLGPAIMP
jgi:hypothetical protein